MVTLALPQQQDDSFPSRRLAADTETSTVEARHLAHDARNWLTVLQVYCDLLRTSRTVTEEGRPWLDELAGAVERGNGLVDSLMGLAQSALQSESQAPRQVDSMPPLDLAAAVERRLPLLRQMAGNKIELEIKTAGDGGPTALREPEFERILLNLVRNAIEAMENGGRLRIVLEHGHGDSSHSILLRVSDTGSGIAAELLPHIFNSGVSTKLAASEDPQSRGFGLAIVRELALRAGGSVRVRSKPRQGSSFTVELPLVEESLSDRSPAKSQMPVSSVRPHRLAVVPEKPKSKTNPGVHFNNCGANRKGTRVPC